LIVLFFLLKQVWDVYDKQRFTRENLDRVSGDLSDLQAREVRLQSEISRLKTEGGAEAEIRERYGLAKPNEEVISIVGDDTRREEELILPEVSWWQKFKIWLE
jgi:cell division protein FtsB